MILAAWIMGTAVYCAARPMGAAFALPLALLATAVLPVVAA